MAPSEMKRIMAFEAGLKVGDVVAVGWTHNYRYNRTTGIVVRVNVKSVRVQLDGGRELTVPRLWNRTWSASNCVAPLAGYEVA